MAPEMLLPDATTDTEGPADPAAPAATGAVPLPLEDDRPAARTALRRRPQAPGRVRRRRSTGPTWRLDARTREVGLAGVAAARQALREAVARSAA
ncbi:MAG: hypothetical protein ACRDYD_00445 [Acidimicrobiales bacterium]